MYRKKKRNERMYCSTEVADAAREGKKKYCTLKIKHKKFTQKDGMCAYSTLCVSISKSISYECITQREI